MPSLLLRQFLLWNLKKLFPRCGSREYSKIDSIMNAKSPQQPDFPPPSSRTSKSRSSRSSNVLPYLLVSILLLLPCFWHPRIEAGDLGSHVYNAWLAELVQQGKAPGVYIVWQWDNVLFDLLLFYFAKILGLVAAEKVTVSLCVLIFFWGLFAFMKAACSRPPWFLIPIIAMLTYGYIFHMGFMNYYLSLGLACIGLSLAWPARKNGLVAAAVLAPLMLLAHPLGFLWFLGTASYRFLWLRFRAWQKLILAPAALVIFLAAHWFVGHHPSYEVEWYDSRFWHLNGADQFHVFGAHYRWFTRLVYVFVVVATSIAWIDDSRLLSFWVDRRLLLELYLVAFLGTALLPENLQTDPTGSSIGALVSRLTLVSAIFGLCWLASLPTRFWHFLFSGAFAAVFFLFVYQDTGLLNRIEANTRRITEKLPFGTRTLSTMFPPHDYRTTYNMHIPDRACIGHCFLVSNYEPSTGQFRVRVQQGSPVVTASVHDSDDMQSGTYYVEEGDLPLKQIYQCEASDLTRICIRDLSGDETNGRLGYHPVTNPFFSENVSP